MLQRVADLFRTRAGHLTADDFDLGRYWRGPSWFNTAWLIHRGLAQLGQLGYAEALAADLVGLAEATGFAEYVDPFTGAAHGARSFSWTAALALDVSAEGAAAF